MSSKKIIKIIVIVILISAIIAFGFYYLNKKPTIKTEVIFSFVDESTKTMEIEVGDTEFKPVEITVLVDGNDMTDSIKFDNGNLDLTKIGSYTVKYYLIYKDKRYEANQIINVVDKTPPVITLEGNTVTILIGEKYEEPGYKVTDNYDKDLQDKVEVTNDIDNQKAGTYKVTYKVMDTSGNECEASREVVVKKPNVVVVAPREEIKVTIPKVVESEHSNTIKKNKFTSTNIYLEGYLKEPLEENKIKLVGEETYEFSIDINNDNYTINLDINDIPNGTYKAYINEEPLLNKMAEIERLARAKVGNKLVTFSYQTNGEVTIKVEDHAYSYDILINPGHGGDDSGAVNEYITEKEMNLKVSMYEKCRYEEHGLRVYMTRTTDIYSNNFGPSSAIRLHKLGYEMGYYGAVSKIVYSNHHNSIGNNYYMGYEILVPGSLTTSDLSNEITIANKWNNIFNITENHLRFYARDYDSEKKAAKLNGETYTFKDYYAVNRIPLAISNVKSIIYEGCYMSNKEDYKWYWQDNNWYKVSEAKIETYVSSLGLTYNADNSSCM